VLNSDDEKLEARIQAKIIENMIVEEKDQEKKEEEK